MPWVAAVVPLAVILVLVAATVWGRRRGYDFGGSVVVRCGRGHVFRSIWIPGASLKALRLGWYRFQRCPVGGHWSLVAPVRDDDLTAAERRMADRYHDVPVP